MKKSIFAIFLITIGWLIASPYVVSHQMKLAADERDGEALAEHIEFPALRQNVKDQLNAALLKEMSEDVDDNPFAAMGAAFGSMMVDGMVDAYVTPASIAEMMAGDLPDADKVEDANEGPRGEKALENAKLSYEDWDKFSITVIADGGEETNFILKRRGLGWKLTNILIPM